MAVVRIRGKYRRKSPQELSIVYGRISVTGRQGSFPAGSLQLTHVEGIQFDASGAAKAGTVARIGLVGSVRDPESTARNTIALQPFVMGSTGTRVANIVLLGGPSAAAASANFIAYGY